VNQQGKKKAVLARARGSVRMALVGAGAAKPRRRRQAAAPPNGLHQANGNGKSIGIVGNHVHPVAAKEPPVRNGKRLVAQKNGAYKAQGLMNGNGANLSPALRREVAMAGGIAAKISLAVLQDGKLVQQCLAHQPDAWSRMYARFHAPLVASIRAFLGPAGRDPYLTEEVAARVWYALVRDDFWLLARFDVRRGCRLSTFLSLIAKAQARLLLRSERRRRLRELTVAKSEIEEPSDGRLDSLSGEEFVATLSPAERTFLVDVLVASSDCDARARYSNQNLWQLRRRVREKLLKFLE
jgi:hypothetical protein